MGSRNRRPQFEQLYHVFIRRTSVCFDRVCVGIVEPSAAQVQHQRLVDADRIDCFERGNGSDDATLDTTGNIGRHFRIRLLPVRDGRQVDILLSMAGKVFHGGLFDPSTGAGRAEGRVEVLGYFLRKSMDSVVLVAGNDMDQLGDLRHAESFYNRATHFFASGYQQ